MAAGPHSRHVFINTPFDASYEPLFVTLIGSLVFLFETGVPDAARRFRRGVRSLRQSAEVMKRELKTKTLFRPLLFRRLVMSATEIAKKQGFLEL